MTSKSLFRYFTKSSIDTCWGYVWLGRAGFVKIWFHHASIKYLRKQYRDSLSQLREQEGEEMDTFLRLYADTKAQIILDQDG